MSKTTKYKVGDTVNVDGERCIVVRVMVNLANSCDLIFDVCKLKNVIPSLKEEDLSV